jgi:hypothetical protein
VWKKQVGKKYMEREGRLPQCVSELLEYKVEQGKGGQEVAWCKSVLCRKEAEKKKDEATGTPCEHAHGRKEKRGARRKKGSKMVSKSLVEACESSEKREEDYKTWKRQVEEELGRKGAASGMVHVRTAGIRSGEKKRRKSRLVGGN